MGIWVPGDAVSGTFLAGVRLRSHFPMVRDLPRLFAYHRISFANVQHCIVGAMRRQCNIEHYTVKFGGTMSKYGIFATLLHYRANMVLLKNLQRWRADNIRPYTVCATELLSRNFGVFVGEDSIFPVVFPMEKQRRRKCADNAVSNICE